MANLERHEKYHPRLHNFQIGFTFSVNAQFGSNLDWSSACLRCFPPPAHLIQISFKQALQKPDKDYDHLTPDTNNLDHFTLLFFFFFCQDGGPPCEPDSGVTNPLSQPPAESGVPLPAINLLYKEGQLREWSGRAPPPLDITALQRDQST